MYDSIYDGLECLDFHIILFLLDISYTDFFYKEILSNTLL